MQKEEYVIPYHYLDLKLGVYRDVHYYERIKLFYNLIDNIEIGDSILDIGCGDGRFLYECHNYYIENLKGIDLDGRAINFAKILVPKSDFEVLDIMKCKNDKKKYEKLFLLDVLEHIKPSEADLFLNSIKKFMNKKSKLIITVPSKYLTLQDKHYRHFDVFLLNKLLIKHFNIEETVYYDNQDIFYKFLKNICNILYPFIKNTKLIKLKNWYYLKIQKRYRGRGIISKVSLK